MPPFHVELLTQRRHRRPDTEFVFTGPDGGMHRRSNFHRRVWIPALTGGDDATTGGRPPIQPGMHFHDLRHTHKTWLIEDRMPEVVQHQRLGHRFGGVKGTYSHFTRPMIDDLLSALQTRWEHTAARWEQTGSTMTDHFRDPLR